jgi:polysaccharide biosynthesis protein PslJ
MHVREGVQACLHLRRGGLVAAIDHAAPLSLARRRPLARGQLLTLLFASLPLWWLAGLFPFVWPIVGFFLLLALIRQGNVVFPRAFALWFLFLAWVPMSVLRLSGDNGPFLFAQRFAVITAATVVFLYIFNSSRRTLPDRAIVDALTLFWAMLVIGAFVAMLFPHLAFSSPFEMLLPGSLVANQFVHDLVHVNFAQVQTFLGYPVGRPAPFFGFTNAWGGGLALLTPIAFAAVGQARSPLLRRTLGALLVLSIVPIVVSLNRGVWLALVLATGYAGLRFALARRLHSIAALIGLLGILLVLIFLTPLGGLITDRLAHPHSNAGREALYDESIARMKQSPLVGYGGPIPSEKSTAPAVGTHSQLFFVAISYGIPAVFFFLTWFGLTFLRARRGVSGPRFWAHVALLVFLMEAPYYLLEMHLVIAMIIAAFIWRDIVRPAEAEMAADRISRSGMA